MVKDNFVFTINEDQFENGWTKENVNVKVTAEGVTNLKYCLGEEECTPNQDVPSNGISITTEGSNYLCVQGDNTKVRCNIYNIDKQAPTLTVKTATPTIIVGESIEIITYLDKEQIEYNLIDDICIITKQTLINTPFFKEGKC